MKLRPLKKKAAIELGVGTMVILVIAVVLLVLALIFVRRIFTGATYNVDQLNDAVRGEINKVFGEEGQRIALYLPGKTATIRQGETFGIAFGIFNDGDPGSFKYEITATDKTDECSRSMQEVNNWIILGGTENNIQIGSGKIAYRVFKIRIPDDTTIGCEAVYLLKVTKSGTQGSYVDTQIFIEVKSSGVGGFF
ncbi:MAG: hypothetical protein KJ767_02080 [Nanoarchaeota archaeon]|nr:hypothetical protein [Nanoarchaeota archaeon]